MSLAEWECEVFTIGAWKSIDELEDCLNLDELGAILDNKRKEEYNQQRFAAAIQGIDLDENKTDSTDKFEEIKRRANMKLANMDESEYTGLELQELGMEVISEE